MAKRMFTDTILESDAFLDMPLTSQALYVHLCMAADNDGFVNPRRVVRMIGANDDDLKILIAKRFLLSFDSGVVVIKHWWINNTKRHDRHVPTTYQNELALLDVKNNKAYTEKNEQLALETGVGNQMATKWQPNGTSMQLNASAIQSNTIHRATKNAAKAAASEISVLYYKVIKKYKLPVINNNNIWKWIKKMEDKKEFDENVNYLTFLLERYQDLRLDMKPEITKPQDIFAKKMQIKSALERTAYKNFNEANRTVVVR